MSTENPSTTSRPRCKPEPGTNFNSATKPNGALELKLRQPGERCPRERRDPRLVEPERMLEHRAHRVHEDRRDRGGRDDRRVVAVPLRTRGVTVGHAEMITRRPVAPRRVREPTGRDPGGSLLAPSRMRTPRRILSRFRSQLDARTQGSTHDGPATRRRQGAVPRGQGAQRRHAARQPARPASRASSTSAS